MADLVCDRALTCSRRGDGRVNEDHVAVQSSAAWILDGATPVLEDAEYTPGESDAAWYVDRLSHHLAGAIAGDGSLPRATREAIDAVRSEYERFADLRRVDAAAEPSATGAIVHWNGGGLEYLVLGDCSLTVSRDGEVSHVTDGRLAAEEEPILEDLGELITDGKQLADARDAVWDRVQALRRRANAPDGYWAFGLEPTVTDHAATGTIAADPGDRLLLSTDGFDRLVTTFDAYDYWGDLVGTIEDRGLEWTLDHLRELESKDPQARSATRFKRHDDATAAWLTFG